MEAIVFVILQIFPQHTVLKIWKYSLGYSQVLAAAGTSYKFLTCVVEVTSISRDWKWLHGFFGSCVFCAPLDRYIRPTLDRWISQHIGWVSTDMSTDISVDTRPISQYVDWHIDRCINQDISWHIDWLSADISVDIAANTGPIRRPLIVGWVSVDRRWYIGIKLRLSMTDV